ncbi:DUF4123 domain-containing protein [Vibrio sp. CAIM 722]|uniref:DUF4123 domain-containing protein n=1 Tax=Vibrio eleionomae TaxID=2653505 RepID=A0A7X4LJJ6_9VIBR|nr:DUF4123 domain-containing protein [Vibrio eleionomae]MZI93094.1 DUF4123 domain-containing protein [Vibrio eleionomae]
MLSVIKEHADLNWFVVLNTTSDEPILKTFYEHGGEDVQGLWLGTPYSDWREVMPRIAPITPEHPFLAWADSEDAAKDWGMVVGSELEFSAVRNHLQSLTQVWMPNVEHVFFRFYDPRFGIKTADLCDDVERAKLMGPMTIWASTTSSVVNPTPKDINKKEFPWWNVPESVVKALTEDDPSTLIMNSLQWLKEECADLYFAYPEAIVKAKTTHLIKRYKKTNPDISLNRYLYQAFYQEVYR